LKTGTALAGLMTASLSYPSPSNRAPVPFTFKLSHCLDGSATDP
jgi:hypothetical protein